MYKVLIVDDDDMIREGIEKAIPWSELQISEIFSADCGEDGEKLFADFLPDIVLTDIRMPGIDGLELLQNMKKLKPETKVIVLSGYDDFAYAQSALKYGAFDYLLKTADMEEVLTVLKKAVNEIGIENEKKKLYTKLRSQLNVSLPLLRYRYLNELVAGFSSMERIARSLGQKSGDILW